MQDNKSHCIRTKTKSINVGLNQSCEIVQVAKCNRFDEVNFGTIQWPQHLRRHFHLMKMCYNYEILPFGLSIWFIGLFHTNNETTTVFRIIINHQKYQVFENKVHAFYLTHSKQKIISIQLLNFHKLLLLLFWRFASLPCNLEVVRSGYIFFETFVCCNVLVLPKQQLHQRMWHIISIGTIYPPELCHMLRVLLLLLWLNNRYRSRPACTHLWAWLSVTNWFPPIAG